MKRSAVRYGDKTDHGSQSSTDQDATIAQLEPGLSEAPKQRPNTERQEDELDWDEHGNRESGRDSLDAPVSEGKQLDRCYENVTSRIW